MAVVRGLRTFLVLALALSTTQGQEVTITVNPSVDNSGCSSAQQLRGTSGAATCRTLNDALGNVSFPLNCTVAEEDRVDGAVIRLVDGTHRLTGGDKRS